MRTPRLFGHHMVAAIAATALAGVLMPLATAQDGSQPVTFTLYRGEGDSGNIALSSWGSGKAEPTTENVLLGDAAIKVTTHGMYQGGRIDFKSPVDLAAAIANAVHHALGVRPRHLPLTPDRLLQLIHSQE